MAAIVGSTVPDYRGLFLRGMGGNSASLGVQQRDAIRNITGYFGTTEYTKETFQPAWGPLGAIKSIYTWYNAGWQNIYGGSALVSNLFDASRVVPTANENRPINKAVRYLIRALE